ncbi:MAG: winged helix-turn-helix transcriptional regulator [Methanosphaera sp.]|nr:winged helix-turn-helix transcriptional regulator [Methanosphaera sp.]
MKKIFQWVLLGTKGSENRVKIIKKIKEKPYNINQLSKELNLNYRTVKHHINKLKEVNLIESYGGKYGKLYFLTDMMKENYNDFIEVLKQIEPQNSLPA